ncbi:hypothetical protein ACQKL5_10025 [Peribacillus sp. NPDC097675]|uniref:hypothetical protein n=1 Tax=Peribacillus sp. NPDC097675 TaxID=3390618 RepID=UPI003CFE012A
MRTWRVGTISMGVTLIGLGALLLGSQISDMSLTTILLSWWPILFIILGGEILFYIYFSRNESTFVKYDFLSIIFVGLLGMVGIVLLLLTSSGIMEQVKVTINSEERTLDLPGFNQKAGKEIQRVVLDPGYYPLTVEGGNNEEVSVFGTYDERVMENDDSLLKKAEDYLMVERKGDTLYIRLKNLPVQDGLLDRDRMDLKATLIIPTNLALEVEGKDTDLTLKPRELVNDWNVDDAGSLSVYLQEKSDISIHAFGVEELKGPKDSWKSVSVKTENEEDSDKKNGTLISGKGSHTLTISNSYNVNVRYH